MQDLTQASQYFPKQDNSDPDRMLLIREVKTILYKSEFLSQDEKQNMEMVLPLFANTVINDLKEALIRENLRNIQNKLNEQS